MCLVFMPWLSVKGNENSRTKKKFNLIHCHFLVLRDLSAIVFNYNNFHFVMYNPNTNCYECYDDIGIIIIINYLYCKN